MTIVFKDGPQQSCSVSDILVPKGNLGMGSVIDTLGVAAGCILAAGLPNDLRESWSLSLSREAVYGLQCISVLLRSIAIS